MNEETLRGHASIEHADEQLDPEVDSPSVPHTEDVPPERPEVYDDSVGLDTASNDDDRDDESPRTADESSSLEERR